MTILKTLLIAGVAAVGLSSVASAANYHKRAHVYGYDAPYADTYRAPARTRGPVVEGTTAYDAPVYGYDAPVRGYVPFNYGAAANEAAAENFQDQFKNTY